MEIVSIQCDLCHRTIPKKGVHWEDHPFRLRLYCPRDGFNGVERVLDLCSDCRRRTHDFLEAYVGGKAPQPYSFIESGLIKGHFPEERKGEIARDLWHDPKFSLGMEYGYILAQFEIFGHEYFRADS